MVLLNIIHVLHINFNSYYKQCCVFNLQKHTYNVIRGKNAWRKVWN